MAFNPVLLIKQPSAKSAARSSNRPSHLRVVESPAGRLVFIGNSVGTAGTYVLKIDVREPLTIAFGRFKRGKLIQVEPGMHAYIGSALGEKGPGCLSRRLVRHATRFANGPPHPIRELMLDAFPRLGLGSGSLAPVNGKHARWNVDHLLDRPSVELVGAFLIRSPIRIEARVGKLIENQPGSIVFERGLGANDITGNTHLLRIEASEGWWQKLPKLLRSSLVEWQSIEAKL